MKKRNVVSPESIKHNIGKTAIIKETIDKNKVIFNKGEIVKIVDVEYGMYRITTLKGKKIYGLWNKDHFEIKE